MASKGRVWTLDQYEAATALDLTFHYRDRGPRTWMTSQRVAAWLDLGGKATKQLKRDVAWLLSLAKRMQES
jgi:hypothetical protein